MTVSGSIPVNLKKFNNEVIEKSIDYLNTNNKNFKVTLMSSPIAGIPQIGFEMELDFKIQFTQDKEYISYANICLNVGGYDEKNYKTGGRNDNTREFNKILEEVDANAVLTISSCPVDDIYYLLYLNFFQAMLVTLKSVGKSVEYFYRDDYGMKDFKYNNVEYFEKLKGIYINSLKKYFKELPPKKQEKEEIFQCEYPTYEDLLNKYYHSDNHTSVWAKEKDIATRYQELAKSQKASKEDVSSILIPLILVIIFLFIMFISFIGYMS